MGFVRNVLPKMNRLDKAVAAGVVLGAPAVLGVGLYNNRKSANGIRFNMQEAMLAGQVASGGDNLRLPRAQSASLRSFRGVRQPSIRRASRFSRSYNPPLM